MSHLQADCPDVLTHPTSEGSAFWRWTRGAGAGVITGSGDPAATESNARAGIAMEVLIFGRDRR